MLNDPVYWEFSQAMAKRITEAEKTDSKRLIYGFRLSLTRFPTKSEMQTLLKQYDFIKKYLLKNPQRAKEIGSKHKPAIVNDVEFASWVLISNSLINLDEAIMKR